MSFAKNTEREQIESLRARLAEAEAEIVRLNSEWTARRERDEIEAKLAETAAALEQTVRERNEARIDMEGAWTSVHIMASPEQRGRLGLDREVPGSHTRDLAQVIARLCDGLSDAERERDALREAITDLENVKGAK